MFSNSLDCLRNSLSDILLVLKNINKLLARVVSISKDESVSLISGNKLAG